MSDDSWETSIGAGAGYMFTPLFGAEISYESVDEYKPNKAPFRWLLPAPHRRRYLPAALAAAH